MKNRPKVVGIDQISVSNLVDLPANATPQAIFSTVHKHGIVLIGKGGLQTIQVSEQWLREQLRRLSTVLKSPQPA